MDKQFRDLMKLYQPQKAPEGFADSVMGKIMSQPQPVYATKPLYLKWGISFFACILAGGLIYAWFLFDFGAGINFGVLLKGLLAAMQWDVFKDAFNDIAGYLSGFFVKIPSEIAYIALASVLLLFVERCFQATRHKMIHQ